ncbi:bacterio-opsin activator domain-containing protein [Halorarius litoreus]|uniref:bacterio-opsin activator domain-containing protein n=1 Tax=Halorarius litoreus TaxID=2962676 RepID=UPI0020CE68B4|nr:helix-turn-helix domain-containing protein [Halorarius litoreus]
MASIAEFTIPPADFPLGAVFDPRPEATLELDRVVPSDDTVMPYFWVNDAGGDMAAIREVFDGLPEIRSAALMEDLGTKGLFRAEWQPDHLGIMSAIPATGVTVLAATGSVEGWTFELRAERAVQFSDFQQYCSDHDINVTLRRLSRLSEMVTGTEYNLTPQQHAALVLAYREGYYRDPSATDQQSLAAQLGITRQALSSRLRRGYRNLIASTLIHGPPGGE